MINSLEEFKTKYPKAAVVNYDIEDVHGYGLCYRTNGRVVERLRKDRGKYNTDYKIFIIRNNKLFELEKGNEENTFHIKEEVTNVDINLFDDIFYISKMKHKDPTIINENIYRIYE